MPAHKFEFVAELPARVRTRPEKYSESMLVHRFAAASKRRPGEWAKWPGPIKPSTAHSYCQKIRQGTQRGFRERGYQAQVRNSVLYVRYVGAGEGGSDV